MKFANPVYLNLIWVLLPLFFVYILAEKRHTKAFSKFVKLPFQRVLLGEFRSQSIRTHFLMMFVVIALLICAAARPQWGIKEQRIQSKGIDLIIAVDVSKSMLAQDYLPDRFTRAKRILQDILWSAKGDRIGVIAFSGSSQVKCPLTLDYSMAKTALQSLEVGENQPGTDLSNAIDTAIKAFDTGSSGERVLVLLTDGEDHSDNLDSAINEAIEKDIKIFTIGIGTSEGIPLLESDKSYKRDKQGKIVNSKLNFDVLQNIASKTNGLALKAEKSGNTESNTIMAEISTLQKSLQQDRIMQTYTERYQYFLLAALAILFVMMLMPNRRNPNFNKYKGLT